MSKHKQLSKIMGIACLSMLLQFSVVAQKTTRTSAQEPSTKSSPTSSSSLTTEISDQLAVVADLSENKGGSDVKAEMSNESVVSEPKMALKNPSIDLKIIPDDSKINKRNFVDPDLEILGEPMVFSATAYALYGRTRSGVYVRRGVIAADPRVLPLGSIVQLKAGSYSGVYTVHDTGKKIKGNIVDLWVPSPQEARLFGRQRIKLHILRFGRKGK
ncbi:MAG: hypothetical protein L0226_15465 [Acidobacteria bacterium]|nr:hypothetical protein [Acidobacteriota bacterium]